MIPHILGVVLLCIIMSAFAVDCGVTVTTILKFNKRLKVMDEMAAKIHKLSDEIGEKYLRKCDNCSRKIGGVPGNT